MNLKQIIRTYFPSIPKKLEDMTSMELRDRNCYFLARSYDFRKTQEDYQIRKEEVIKYFSQFKKNYSV